MNDIIDAVVDAYEGEDIWGYGDEVRNQISNND